MGICWRWISSRLRRLSFEARLSPVALRKHVRIFVSEGGSMFALFGYILTVGWRRRGLVCPAFMRAGPR